MENVCRKQEENEAILRLMDDMGLLIQYLRSHSASSTGLHANAVLMVQEIVKRSNHWETLMRICQCEESVRPKICEKMNKILDRINEPGILIEILRRRPRLGDIGESEVAILMKNVAFKLIKMIIHKPEEVLRHRKPFMINISLLQEYPHAVYVILDCTYTPHILKHGELDLLPYQELLFNLPKDFIKHNMMSAIGKIAYRYSLFENYLNRHSEFKQKIQKDRSLHCAIWHNECNSQLQRAEFLKPVAGFLADLTEDEIGQWDITFMQTIGDFTERLSKSPSEDIDVKLINAIAERLGLIRRYSKNISLHTEHLVYLLSDIIGMCSKGKKMSTGAQQLCNQAIEMLKLAPRNVLVPYRYILRDMFQHARTIPDANTFLSSLQQLSTLFPFRRIRDREVGPLQHKRAQYAGCLV